MPLFLNHFRPFVAQELKYTMYKTTKQSRARFTTSKTMKTTTTIAALLIALSINVTAQVKVKPRNQDPVPLEPRNGPKNNPAPQNNNQSGDHWGHGWAWGGGYNNCGPNVGVTIGFGSPYYGNAYCYNQNYYNGYSAKKAARYSIRSAGNLINQAVAFNTWNDIYSPLLAKAIRHYNYAREQYWWGNYPAAYNHAERAGYLAWYSLQYFQDPYYNNGGYGQPNPYSDPYNPYYRSDQAGSGMNQGGNQGFKKGEVPQMEGIDKQLPGSEKADKEVIRTFDKSEIKED